MTPKILKDGYRLHLNIFTLFMFSSILFSCTGFSEGLFLGYLNLPTDGEVPSQGGEEKVLDGVGEDYEGRRDFIFWGG